MTARLCALLCVLHRPCYSLHSTPPRSTPAWNFARQRVDKQKTGVRTSVLRKAPPGVSAAYSGMAFSGPPPRVLIVGTDLLVCPVSGQTRRSVPTLASAGMAE